MCGGRLKRCPRCTRSDGLFYFFLTANRDSLKCKCGQERDDGHPTRMHILTFKWQTLWQRSLACWQWHHMTSNHPSVSNIPLISCLLSWRLKCRAAYIGGLVCAWVGNNNEEITRPVKVPPLLGQVWHIIEVLACFPLNKALDII